MGTTSNALNHLPANQVKQEFGGIVETTTGMDVAANAVSAHAKAMVESRYIMAMRNPRNMDQVRQDLIKECSRPNFANNPSAFYRKPIGNGVEGLGIRFVEVALRCMKNVLIETKMVYENDQIEVHSVSVTDLESNITYPADVKVSKTVERSKPSDDGSYISVRMNSYNKPTYTIPAQDDDLLNKRGALISKAIRTLGLRIIPGDLQDEAEQLIKSIRANDAARDPDASRRRLIDSFAAVGVKVADLVAYIGRPLDTCTPAEAADLIGILGALKDGEATWATVMENKAKAADQDKPAGGPKPEKSATAKATKAAKQAADQKPADAAPAESGNAGQDQAPDPEFVAAMESTENGDPSNTQSAERGKDLVDSMTRPIME